MRSRPPPYSFPPIIFPFTDLPETDPAIESKEDQSRSARPRESASAPFPRFSSLTLPTSIGAEPPRSFTWCQTRSKGRRYKHLSDRWHGGCQNLARCPHLPLHGIATFFRPISPAKGNRRPGRRAAAIAAADQVLLARHDNEYGCVGAQRHGAAAQQLPADRRPHILSRSTSMHFQRFRVSIYRTKPTRRIASISVPTGEREF